MASTTPPGTTKKTPAKKGAAPPEKGAEQKERKPRAPRVDYGYKPGATIMVTEKEGKYRGKRGEYYERLKAANGKTVEDFFKTCPDNDPPRGWLRFFVSDGAAELKGGKDPEPKAPAKKKEPASAPASA